MIPNYRTVITLYILIILLRLCHSMSHSSSANFNIDSDTSTSYTALPYHSKSFSKEPFRHYSLFSLITHNGKTSLFVVCKNDIVIQIKIDTMEFVNIFRTDSCPNSLNYECDEPVTINLISEINLLNQKMMFFCYIIPQNHINSASLTNCAVPKNNVLPEELKWTKKGFTSTSNDHRTFAVQSAPYIFIGTYIDKSLSIIRTKLPDIFGKIDSHHDLVTPRADFYFEKNSKFLTAFGTKYEIYYVIHEPVSAKSHSISECLSSSDTTVVSTTRLIRICKDDPGVRNYDEHNFGTSAKTDIICPVGDESDQYHYTNSISASWSGDKLYLLFESQKNAPSGKVLCVYDEFAFNVAFNSGMVPPLIFPTMDKLNVKVDNPIEDICKKLTEKSLSAKQLTEAASLAANGLYRLKNVLPIRAMPLLKLRNLSYHTVSTFRLTKVDPTTVVMLISHHFIRLVSHMDDHSICHIKDFQLSKNETISQVKGDTFESKVFVHISTNKRMIQLQLSICKTFHDKISCLNKAPNICGWDSRQTKCTLLTDDVDNDRWQRSTCRNTIVDDITTLPETCSVTYNDQTLSCICKYCFEDEGCAEGERVKITNCTDTRRIGTYSDWGTWSECDMTSQYQKRSRTCNSDKCIGLSTEMRKCPKSSSIVTTSWTKWYKSDNTKYHHSFRAKCPRNQLWSPSIEERVVFCGVSCEDKSLIWSPWSECVDINIQYRLFNCTSFDVCPYNRSEVKVCPATSRKLLHQPGQVDGSYSVIHIALAILIVSLMWLIILGVVSIYLFRYSLKKSNKRSMRAPNYSNKGITSAQLFAPKSLLCETLNDYIIPDISSPFYHPHLINRTISLTSTIQSDQATGSSSNIYTPIPLITENHSNLHQH